MLSSSRRARLEAGVAAILAAVALSACGNLSDVGNQDNKVPVAVAEVVGYSGPNTDGDVTVNVRAQSEIVLTGKDSLELDKPIVGFLWEAENTAANSAVLTVRNSSTINVGIPAVSSPTDMQFRLTVKDSDGDTDTAHVTLKVLPVLDADQFLTAVGHAPRLRVVAGTSQPVAASANFKLQMQARVTYTARSGARNTVTYPVGTAFDGAWLTSASLLPDTGSRDIRNPLVQFSLPGVDQDQITRQFQATLPRSAPSLADPAFIDDADLELILTLAPGAGAANASIYVLDANDTAVAQQSNGGSGDTVQLTLTAAQVEALRLSSGGLENKQTAQSYYAKIDPQNSKLTLNQWLTENCFSPTATDYAADAHAVYVNNFDLGFGRDMYFRSARPAGCTSSTFASGDAASVVVNYATLEAAAKRIDPVLAVAMEYKATDAARTDPGLVMFYVFAPDEGTGEMRRVLTANFDGRGEKFVPGACTACHGGRPTTPSATPLNTYAASADLGSTFMPWDLESFLYSDTDPAFPTDTDNAALRATFTRARQESELKKLNLAVYGTYGNLGSDSQFHCYTDFSGPCELVELWYGGAGVPSATFVNRQVASGWRAGGGPQSDNPSSAENLYLDVVARNCRACHTQRVRESDPGTPRDPQFLTYSDFRSEDVAIRSLVFDEGSMPLARLTTDRLWTSSGTTPSAGAVLANHLGLDAAASTPGASIASLTLTQQSAAPSTSFSVLQADSNGNLTASRKRPIRLDGSASLFVRSFTHTLVAPADSTAGVVGANNPIAEVTPDLPGVYTFALNVGGIGSRSEQRVNVTVANAAPVVNVDTYGVAQGMTLSVPAQSGLLSSATDADDDNLTASLDTTDATCLATNASQLTVNADGSFTYAHNGNLASTDFFKVAVSDGLTGGVTTICVSVSITSVDDTQAPVAPSTVTPTAQRAGSGASATTPVQITWSAGSDTDQFGNPRNLLGYQVQRRSSPAGVLTNIGSVVAAASTRSVTDTSAAPNQTYYYSVVAIDGAAPPNRTSSSQVSVTTFSSFRVNVNPIWSTSLDSAPTCTTCHNAQAPVLNGAGTEAAAAQNFATLTSPVPLYIATSDPENGLLPCWPSRTCPAPSANNHTGGTALSKLLPPSIPTTDKQMAYQQILKWIQEGAVNN